MHRIWLILNPSSGSAPAARDEFDRAAADAGLEIAGCTHFPSEELPGAPELTAAGCDTLVVFAGDGTINAATSRVDDWPGQCLVLPGGTMNMLAHRLHGTRPWAEVLAAAGAARLVTLPVAACGERRAMCGVIAGPASGWVHARERARRHVPLGRLWGAVRFAWRKTFARSVRIVGIAAHRGAHRAVIITPQDDGLEIASVDAVSWVAAARIGWSWLVGGWRHDRGVHITHGARVTLAAHRTVSALFDGEFLKLRSPAVLEHGCTRLRFLSTTPQ